MTKQQLHDLIDQYIVENTQGRITATQLNTILSNTVDALKAMQESVTPAESTVQGSVEGQYVEQVTQSSEGVISVTKKKLPAEVFIATYGTTTFEEVTTAFNAGKLILCIINEDPDFYACRLSYYDNEGESGKAEFDSIDHNGNVVGAILYGDDSWDVEYTAFQKSLQSGVNIKKINNNSIVGPGNLSIPCGKKAFWIVNKYLTISAGSVIGPGLRLDIEYESYGVGSFIIYSKGTSVGAYYYGADYTSKIDNIALYRDTNNNTKYVIEATSTPSGWSTFTFLFNGNEPVINTESDISTWTHLHDASVTVLQNELISGTTIKTINNTSLLGSGNIDANDVFVAVYGTTTFQECVDAIDAGKTLYCINSVENPEFYYASLSYYYDDVNDGAVYFTVVNGNTVIDYFVNVSDIWSTTLTKTELTSNKVTSLSPSSTDIQYPSAKAVYDQLLTKLGTTGTAYNTAAIPFAQVDNTSTSTAFTATVPGITELKTGTCVMLHNGIVSSESGFTLNVNGLGAHPVFNNMTEATRDTTIFNVAYTMLFVYDATRVVDGITGAWCCYRGFDGNTNTIGYQLRTAASSLPMQSKTYRYRLLFTSADGAHFVPANNSSSTNATASRAVCQDPIDPFGKIVYYGTTASVDVGSRPSASNLWSQYTLSLGYSFNTTGAALTLTSWKPVYVKCTPQTNGSAIIDSTTPYVQDLPTTEDGKIYIFLGIAYATTNIELYQEHPVYYYKSGAIRLWANTAEVDISGKENTSNKVTALSSTSTDAQYPSAKCVYDLVGDIETLLAAI